MDEDFASFIGHLLQAKLISIKDITFSTVRNYIFD